MPRLHRDRRIEQLRVVAGMLSLDADPELEFTPFRVSHRLGNADVRSRFAWCQFTESLVRSMEIVPCGVRINALLDRRCARHDQRQSPPPLQTPNQPLDFGVELPCPTSAAGVLNSTILQSPAKRSLELPASIGDDVLRNGGSFRGCIDQVDELGCCRRETGHARFGSRQLHSCTSP